MGVRHEMKAWGKVRRSGRLRFTVEGKAKRTNMEDSSQRESPDSLEKGKDTTTGEVMKRGEKEDKGGGPTHESSGKGGGDRAAKGTKQQGGGGLHNHS